jgi:(E)-4-hydroxy-3-methyl-but-2-enyl pyrophosphate reductase
MKINVAKFGGFCFGVKRAIDIAQKTVVPGSRVAMLGDIVHNEDVIKDIARSGIKRIKRIGRGAGTTLILSAHGTGNNIIEAAQRSGYKIIDATCPMVKSIHKIAQRMEQEGYTIIIIGDKNHSEVHGIIGQLTKRPIVIERLHDIPVRTLKKVHKAAVVAQSTQNAETVFKIIDEIKSYIPDLQFFNTICKPTRMRQAEIRTMPLENDVMVIIGSRTSANTQRLCQISHALNEKTHCVQSKEELRPEWFRGARSVGVASGASTPDKTIQEAIDYLRSISRLLKK